MFVLSLLYVLPLFASYVQAGSQVWETSAVAVGTSPGFVTERAVYIQPVNDQAGVLRWPKKTITYAFNNAEAEEKLNNIFEAGKRLWNQLNVKGFQYEKIKMDKCRARRVECLVVFYNDRGKFKTTVGLPAAEEGRPGPSMHLSDVEEVGNLDLAVNAAHEIGHAWGLKHEHQYKGNWGSGDGAPGEFLVGDTWMWADFHPENLKDYEAALKKMAEDKGLNSPDDLDKEDKILLISSDKVAERYGFSGVEWMPALMGDVKADDEPDKDSLMIYPSGAGAKGEVIRKDDGTFEDRRLPVLTYADGTRMPLKKGPSGRDISALEELYETDYREISRLHNDKSSKFKGLLKKVRSTMSLRAGHTEESMC